MADCPGTCPGALSIDTDGDWQFGPCYPVRLEEAVMKLLELKLRLIAPVVVVCCFVCLGLLFAAPASAQLQQGFEGSFPPPGWTLSVSNPTSVSLGGVAGSTSGITPTQGLQYGWISTGCVSSAGTTCPGVATTQTPLYSTLGLGSGTGLGTPT